LRASARATACSTAVVLPRGPTTAAQALALLAGSVAVGLAPAAHIALLALGRANVQGLTVRGIHLDTAYGILAFVLGRGLYGLLALLPMVVGVAYGVALARRLALAAPAPAGPGRARRYARRAARGLPAAALLALAVRIALPASTPPILGPDSRPLAGSIATLEPVLLYLSGGPLQRRSPRSLTESLTPLTGTLTRVA
jgi:hypothetical protein